MKKENNKAPKILIVMEEGIGNMVMLTPALSALKIACPDCHVTVIGREPSIQVIKGWEVVDKILQSPDNDIYDIGFLTLWSRQFLQNNQQWMQQHCSEWIKLKLDPDQHEADSDFQIARYFGFEESRPAPHCQVSPAVIELPQNKKIAALSDTTLNNGAWERKRWPYYIALAEQLISNGYNVLLVGGEREAERFLQEKWSSGITNCLGKLSVQETADVLKKCDLFIGNDSGPAHLAGAVGIPTYVLFGPTLISKNRPLGKNVKTIHANLPCSPCQYTERWAACHDWQCMKLMPPDQVYAIVMNDRRHAVRVGTDRSGPQELIGKDYSECRIVMEDNCKMVVRGEMKVPLRFHLVGAGKANYPWGMENEIRRALELEGIEIIETDYRLEKEGFAEKFLRPAHLMLVCKGSGIAPELIKQYPGKTLLWYQDDIFSTEHAPRDLKYNGHVFDTVYTFDRSAIEAYRQLGMQDVRWLPLAMSPALHRKLYVGKKHDVGFVGNIHPNRKPFFERLSQKFNLFVARAFMEDMVRILNESKIVINLGVGPTGIQQRVFETLGCGSFLLTNEIPQDSRLFEDKKHLVYFNEKNVDELIGYYLAHEEERERIAHQGYVEAQNHHTFRDRIGQILEDIFLSDESGSIRMTKSVQSEEKVTAEYLDTALAANPGNGNAAKNMKTPELDMMQQKIETALRTKSLGQFRHLSSFVHKLQTESLRAVQVPTSISRWKAQTSFRKDPQKRELLIVAGAPRVELAKMSDALRRTGSYSVWLLCAQSMAGNVGGFYTQFFDEIIGYQNLVELVYFLLAAKPDLIIGRAKFQAAALALIFSDTPVIFHAYDIYRFSRPPRFSVPLEAEGEQFSFENAHGIIHKGHENEIEEFIKPVYALKGPVLHFHPFCWEPFFVKEPPQKLSQQDGKIHIVYTGLVEPPSTDKRFNGEVHFLETAQKIAEQKIHFHIYYSPHLGSNDDYYKEYFEFASQNPYFHFHSGLPYDKLCREIAQYDYGWNVFDYRYAIMPDTWRKLASTNKIFTYLEAGIPMIVDTENEYISSLVKNWSVGFNMKWDEIPDLHQFLKQQNYKTLVDAVKAARETLSISKQIHRLEQFFDEILKEQYVHV
jgi:ADP-heptose:LPS heptosyltransferase